MLIYLQIYIINIVKKKIIKTILIIIKKWQHIEFIMYKNTSVSNHSFIFFVKMFGFNSQLRK